MSVPTIDITTASVADAEEILALQKLAYQSEAERYQDFSIPPLLQTADEMREDLRKQVVCKAVRGTAIVASARAYQEGDTAFIGRVIVHPNLQGQGLGKRIMAAIEARFPQAQRFELFTGHLSTRNLRFYRGLGYRDFKTVAVSPSLSFVYLEKSAR
jgi:ribosomal protein S18 acetylase RimI-like enzyme